MSNRLLIGALVCWPLFADAADERQLSKYLMSFKCQYCDLSGANFNEKSLQGSDLMNSNLSGATLIGAI